MKISKRIFSCLIALLLIAVLIPAGVFSVSATSVTADQAIAWVKSQCGKGIDADGKYGCQCVDLILAYYSYLGVSRVSGNGKDYSWNNLPSGWTRTAGGTPQKGDILVYTNGDYGHVAIFESTYSHYHQNYAGHSYVENITSHTYNWGGSCYWGCIHPNFSSGTAHVHAYNSKATVQKATCTSAGRERQWCVCGAERYVEIPKLPHSYTGSAWVYNANQHWHNCTVCGGASVDIANHTYKDTVVKPTTSAGGYTLHTCSVCGYSYKSDITAKLPTYTLRKDSNGTWRYYADNKFDPSYTGLVSYNGSWFYVINGVLNWNSAPTLTKYGSTWFYVANGKYQPGYTGLVSYGGGWFYVENGKLDFSSKPTLTKYGNTWFYTANGKYQPGYTGLVLYKDTWFYVSSGKVNFSSAPTLTKHGDHWFYVVNGKYNNKYTGLVKYGNSWFYVDRGCYNTAYTGLVLHNNVWYYVEYGKLNWNSAPTLTKHGDHWFYVANGKYDAKYTGLVKYGNSWFYVDRGYYNTGYTGLVKRNNTWYYVEHGKLNWNSAPTLTKYGNTWFYVANGRYDNKYTGLAKYGNSWFYVENGKWNAKYNGTWYQVANGKVVF